MLYMKSQFLKFTLIIREVSLNFIHFKCVSLRNKQKNYFYVIAKIFIGHYSMYSVETNQYHEIFPPITLINNIYLFIYFFMQSTSSNRCSLKKNIYSKITIPLSLN